MKKDYTQMNQYVLAIPILAIGLQDSASACISPAIASICQTYPDIPTPTVQLLVTLPSLTCCVVALFYGWLASRINPRILIIAGLCMFVAGGMAPIFMTSFYAIFACRMVLGMGAGLTLPACNSVVPQLYKGQMRENMMGWNMTAGALGCTIMIFIGGQFAVIDWHLSFLGYSVGIITLALVLLLLPEIPIVKGKTGRRPSSSEIFENIKWLAWIEIGVYFIGNMFATLVTSNISLFVDQGGIGTAAVAGNALSLQMIGAASGALFYGLLKKRLRYNVIPFAWLVMAAGFFLVAHSTAEIGVYAGMVIAGVGVGVVWPAYIMRITELCSPVAQATVIAVASALQGFGNFFNPVVGAWCVSLFGVHYGADLILIPSLVLAFIAVAVFMVNAIGIAKARSRA